MVKPKLPCFILHRLQGCWYSENAKTVLDDLFGNGYKDKEYDKKTRIDMDIKYKQKWSSWPKVTYVNTSNEELIIGGYDDLVKLTKSIQTIFARNTIQRSDIDNAISAIMVVRQKPDNIHYQCLVHLAKAVLRQNMDK